MSELCVWSGFLVLGVAGAAFAVLRRDFVWLVASVVLVVLACLSLALIVSGIVINFPVY